MSNENKLLLSYLLSLPLLVGFSASLALRKIGLAIFLLLLSLLARWCVDPVRKARKNVLHTRAGKVTTLLFALGTIGLAIIVVVQSVAVSKLPVWIYTFPVLFGVPMVCEVIREEIRAAQQMDAEGRKRCEAQN